MSAPCGTYAGFSRHRRENTPACAPCKAAAAQYRRTWMDRNGSGVETNRRRNRLRWRALMELRRRYLAEYDQIYADLQNSEQR